MNSGLISNINFVKRKIGKHRNNNYCSVRSYGGVAPYLEDGGDGGVWLEQEKLPPFLPANFHISITIQPDSGKEEKGGEGEGGGRGRRKRRREGEEVRGEKKE